MPPSQVSTVAAAYTTATDVLPVLHSWSTIGLKVNNLRWWNLLAAGWAATLVSEPANVIKPAA
jgi:hypothetical protein